MKKHHCIAALTVAAALMIGCVTSLDKFTREPCVSMPNDSVFKALQDNCIKCHPRDFTTKEDVCTRKKLIIDAVAKGRMPKMGKLYDHYRETLVNWK